MKWWTRPASLPAIEEEAAEDEAADLVETPNVTFFTTASTSNSSPTKFFPVLPPLSNFASLDHTSGPHSPKPRRRPFVPRDDDDHNYDDRDGLMMMRIEDDDLQLAPPNVPIPHKRKIAKAKKTEDVEPNSKVVPSRILVDAAVNTEITMDDILCIRRNERLRSPFGRSIVVDDVTVGSRVEATTSSPTSSSEAASMDPSPVPIASELHSDPDYVLKDFPNRFCTTS